MKRTLGLLLLAALCAAVLPAETTVRYLVFPQVDSLRTLSFGRASEAPDGMASYGVLVAIEATEQPPARFFVSFDIECGGKIVATRSNVSGLLNCFENRCTVQIFFFDVGKSETGVLIKNLSVHPITAPAVFIEYPQSGGIYAGR
jgi:hypothetical protein